jgi:hypothetical protein
VNRFSNLIFFSIFAFTIGGCQPPKGEETEHRGYREGQRLLRENHPEQALSQFLNVLKDLPNALKSHLEIGQIYLHTYDDPIYAIYYFRQFLLHNVHRQNESIVQDLIERAKKRFLQQMLGKNKELHGEYQNFLPLLKHLKEENLQLKQRLESGKI